jgi:rare lipoprotein A
MRTLPFVVIAFLASTMLLSGCANNSRYSIKNDVAPDKPLIVDHIEDAHPKYEALSRGGNKDYTLLGNHYNIVTKPDGFKERGLASWYGVKFHGHTTSSGETYDMYSMSAAHKTLPLPSYIKVTNLDNGKVAIVRVNDRGPFHSGRVVDLSYAAAYKLGIVDTGTATVEIETIIVNNAQQAKIINRNTTRNEVIQVAASQHLGKTKTLSNDLSKKLSVSSFIDSNKNNHRILLGPFDDEALLQQTLEQVKKLGFNSAFIRKYSDSQ